MRHIDLFSGIGGFALAAKTVFPDYENLFFCDNNEFCQAVLRKNFPGCTVYGDIRTVANAGSAEQRGLSDHGREEIPASWGCDFEQSATNAEGTERERDMARSHGRRGFTDGYSGHAVDLLTGGFPCQPFSAAGKRRGTDDDRHLWPEMLRVIRAFSPRWVIAENVRGIIAIEQGMVFEQVCLDLEGAGYEVQAFIVPACAVNAPHRRDRVWFVARANTSDPASDRWERGREGASAEEGLQPRPGTAGELAGGFERPYPDASDPRHTGLQGDELPGTLGEGTGKPRPIAQCPWDEDWYAVALRTCVRGISNGLPAELDGFKLSSAGHRRERLKALGNAIVPQVAMEIMRAIKAADSSITSS